MKVACWQDERYGPALVVVIQAGKRDSGPPETASIPQAPPGPMRQYMAKGTDVTWEQWVQHLSGHMPYGGQWSVEEVPDGRTAHQALAILRQQAAMHGLDSSQPVQ